MASFEPSDILDILECMEGFLQRNRPPEEIRSKVDLGYRMEGLSILIFEIRPQWGKPETILEHPFAKTTYIKTKKLWKVFWMRASGNWESYGPTPTVKSVSHFVKLVDEDKHHCFKG